MKRRAVIFGAGCALAAGSALALRPRRRAAEVYAPVKLDEQVPLAFDGWSVDHSIIPVLPDPQVQAKLDAIYNQVLARTYVNADGARVMLSIAYGSDQGTDATAVHRPEFCYSAQGFVVRAAGQATLQVDGRPLRVNRVVGQLGKRFEPITYWVTLNDRALLPGVERKLAQIRLGLSGLIPDGLLMRTSTVGMETEPSFALQERFIAQMAQAMPDAVRVRYFGRG